MKNSMIYPSASTWITPRANDIQLTTDNMVLIMPKPIAELRKVWLRTYNSARIYCNLSDGQSGNITIDNIATAPNDDSTKIVALDITKYFVEKATYDTLSVRGALETATADICKNNTSYYVRNETDIKLCTERQGIFSEEPLLQAVYWALKTMLTQQKLYNGSREILSFGTSVSVVGSILNWEYRVEFTPLAESTRLNVVSAGAKGAQFNIPYSQQQQIASSVGLGRNMQSAANRMGAATKQIVRKVTDPSHIREVGEVMRLSNEPWRLTDVEMTINPKRAICTETWGKRWSVRSEFTGVNREFRSWNIPAEKVERNLLWEDYLYLSRTRQLAADPDVLIDTAARKTLLKYPLGQYESGYTEITGLWIEKPSTAAIVYGAIAKVSAFGFGNSLVFNAKTEDNVSAGVKRKQLTDGDSVWQECVDVFYCNTDGALPTAKLSMAANIANGQADIYPEYSTGTSNVNIIDPDGAFLFKDKTFTIDKDPSEQINFTYQLHLISGDANLIIGTAWGNGNQLVKQYDSAPTLKYWKLSKPLPQGAQTMTTAYGTTRTANPVSYSEDTNQLIITAYGCVTDENNNIIMANNRNVLQIYYVNFTHDYKQIGG